MLTVYVFSGSVFDLVGGSPNLGFGPTAAVAVVVIPGCLFLFYASILKATAETEADDKEFLKGK
jgi:MFS superfamily sulfate permease-like transporter